MASSSISSSKSASAPERPSGRILKPAFYARETTVVARELLGKLLIVRTPSGDTAGRIVETEAYSGDDPASHSARGETARCSVMFGSPGRAYVYFIYGMYEMLNFVTERPGYPGAVLIRALEPVSGLEVMKKRRGDLRPERLANGPGKLSRAMGIEMRHNELPLQGPELWVTDDGWRPAALRVSPRVGIRLGVDRPWRFYIDSNPCVSRAPQDALSLRL